MINPKHFIKFENVYKRFSDGNTPVNNVSFSINKGEFVTLLGPSGCGKTTTLNLLAGFENPTSGRILFNDVDIKSLPINQRPTAMVFQNYALFPNMNVYKNIAYGLKVVRKSLNDISKDKLLLSQKRHDKACIKSNKNIKKIEANITKLSRIKFQLNYELSNHQFYKQIKNIKNEKDLRKYIESTQEEMYRKLGDNVKTVINHNKFTIFRNCYLRRLPKLPKLNIDKMNEFQISIINVYMLFQYRKRINQIIAHIDLIISKLDAKRSYYLNYPELVDEKFKKKFTTRKLTKSEIDEKVKNVIKVIGLEGAEEKYPSDLSGGMQQRVALARAIVIEPEILLLDEPLSALDAKVRQQMQLELKFLHQKLKLTFILVTHDQEEALFLSNKIIVMANGKVQQIDTSRKIYEAPANMWVAQFIGDSNIFVCEYIGDNKIKFNKKTIDITQRGFNSKLPNGTLLNYMVRPEDIKIVPEKSGFFDAKIIQCVYKGVQFDILLSWNNMQIKAQSDIGLEINKIVGISWEPMKGYCIHYVGEEE
ncbi:MAG: ATP-binding cassette domain-containing protein [Mycoplasma sp.]|nr:ATP-binding cassette domain-containing protein [Mycoplasma sp.]